jgi:hypothetical protein
MRSSSLFFPWFLALASCAGAPPPRADDPASTGAAVVVPEKAEDSSGGPAKPQDAPLAIPTACAAGGDADTCMLGTAFADRICAAAHPDVALVLFGKGSPWTRIYLRGDVDGWNAEGGGSARARLAFDEEVIVLKRRAPAGGAAIVVGASGGYQVMRWDGNCYSLDEGEVTRRRPPRAKHPGIPWKYLSEKTQGVLLDNAAVKAAFDKRRKECKGVTMGDVSLACEQADTAFSDGIVTAIRAGLAVPVPEL